MKKYRQHSEEFKRILIERIDKGEITKAAAARENNLASTLIDRWREQIHEGTMVHKPTLREKQLEKELDRYKKKVAELVIQNDLFKKLHETYPRLKKSSGYIVTGKNTDQNGQDVP
jgi:transposase-like protein